MKKSLDYIRLYLNEEVDHFQGIVKDFLYGLLSFPTHQEQTVENPVFCQIFTRLIPFRINKVFVIFFLDF